MEPERKSQDGLAGSVGRGGKCVKRQVLKGCWMCTERNVEFAKKEEKRNAGAQSSQRRGREELAIFKIEVREGI